MKLLILFSFVACTLGLISAQQTSKDTLIPYRKAALFSACLPGAGQVYNSIHTTGRKNAFWKVPLIAAGLGGTTYILIQNQRMVQGIKSEYAVRQTGSIGDPQWLDYDDQALVSLYEQYARLRDLSILGIGAVYALQILDAAVEAHFLNFDVSKNLSLKVRPSVSTDLRFGLTAKLNLH
jgi:hypothetical protein